MAFTMSETTRNNAEETRAKGGPGGRGRPFAPGNPGRPKGARNRATVAVEAMLDGEAEAITRVAIDLAKTGDAVALRLCMDRIAPPRRDRPVMVELPKIDTAADVVAALAATLTAMAEGDLTPSEAATVAGVLEAKRKAIETVELEQRVAALEGGRRDEVAAHPHRHA
jgi:hypothetical protein